jgi:hypothetical protein
VDLRSASISDAGLAHISRHPNLNVIACGELNDITDAGLIHLAALRSLKRLEVVACPQLTPAGFAAFQKARPDVTLVR